MEELSQSIMNGADCAIGYEAAHTVYRSLKECRFLKKLAYPIILLIFLFVFSIFTVFYLLPQVEILFNEFDIQKSFIIQCLFVLLHAIPIFLTLITIINIILMIFIYQSIAKQKFNQIDFLINHTHFIKKLICKYYSLKFAIYYNELLIQHYDTTSIIETLYDKITDSDIKMIVYELYHLIVNGHDFNLAVNDFPYFSDDFKKFISIIQNSHENQSLENYIQLTFMQLNQFVSKFIKIIVPLIYGFVATFVIVVYKDGNVIVFSVFKNSPAQEAGLKFNDKIMEVNGKSTKGMSTTDVVALIKDAKRKDANIKIERDGTTLEFDVEKREVVIESVESKTYDVNGKKIGYVVINTFANNTYSQFRSNIEQLEKENISGLVIDVRNNSGGYLHSVTNMLDMFLPKGTISYQIADRKTTYKYAATTSESRNYPVSVLVNMTSMTTIRQKCLQIV